MKAMTKTWIILIGIGLASCINDNVGPRGPEGPEGPQGESGYVFEFENVDFTGPEYEEFLAFPDDFETLSSDVVLVYMLWDVVNIDGTDTEIWRQIPQTVLTDDGTLQYNFDFSMVDVRLFMNADFDLGILGAIDTDDWVVRVVVVPGNFWNSSRLNRADITYEDVKEMLELPELATPQNKVKRRF